MFQKRVKHELLNLVSFCEPGLRLGGGGTDQIQGEMAKIGGLGWLVDGEVYCALARV